MKTSELIGPALDWAVAKASDTVVRWQKYFITTTIITYISDWDDADEYCPSTNWPQGGPIIEREGIQLHVNEARTEWLASCWGYPRQQYGPTPLIAAMRCFVASKLGGEVDVPMELV